MAPAGRPAPPAGGVVGAPSCGGAAVGGGPPLRAGGVAVVHGRLPVDDPGDGDRMGNLWMVVVRALDQEPLLLKPLERGLPGYDGAGKRRMSGLGRPRAGQPLPALK